MLKVWNEMIFKEELVKQLEKKLVEPTIYLVFFFIYNFLLLSFF